MGESAGRLDNCVEHRVSGRRAVWAVAGHISPYEVGVSSNQNLVSELEFLSDTGPPVGQPHVTGRQQAQEPATVVRVLQVQTDAPFAAIAVGKHRAHRSGRSTETAEGVTVWRGLHLDHFGAEIHQHLASERTAYVASGFYDSNTVERTCGHRLRSPFVSMMALGGNGSPSLIFPAFDGTR